MLKKKLLYYILLGASMLLPYALVFISGENNRIAGVRIDFLILVLTLLMVSIYHHHTLETAVAGLFSAMVFNVLFNDVSLLEHFGHEKLILINLFGLLLGFALLAKHFEESGIPDLVTRVLPSDWKGPFFMLVIVFILSSFLDNIAASMIGGTIAMVVFRNRVHPGYIAAIVAASNAGGSGSVVGDTTTTMMWIEGVPAGRVMPAYLAAIPALLFFGYFAARQQVKHQPVFPAEKSKVSVSERKLLVVLLILVGAIAANILFSMPAAGVWAAILLGSLFVSTPWKHLWPALKSSIFLLSLVSIASLMPVDELPEASWESSLTLGFVSSVFDNIPLTKIALSQNGYDWGILAYSVGFGGSMIWFGSSAGVAITNLYPESRSVVNWIKNGWHILVAYVIGFFVLLAISGWSPWMIVRS